MKIEIKNRFTLDVIYSGDFTTIAAAVTAAVLAGVSLHHADLRYADLTSANLTSANLTYADLTSANLTSANLRYANLRYADLTSANLTSANLRYADLTSANLRYAKEISAIQLARMAIIPSDGEFVAWKKCRNGIIVKLAIPADAKRSHSTGRKCRAEFVRVMEVMGAEVGVSDYDHAVKYRAGETVRCDQWNEDRWTECGGGIHFFITRLEAEAYDL